MPPGPPVSLARALSKWGLCSRAEAERWIREGRVTLRGATVTNPAVRLDMARDRVTVDGQPVDAAKRVYVMLNKPRGLVASASDEQGRDTVYRCFAGTPLPWLGPVGRLDRASEGLLLFTNDTRWAARLLDPASHVDKVYHVQIDRLPEQALADALVAGVPVEGELWRAKEARVLRAGQKSGWLEIVLDEGKNRQIRRLLEGLGVEVQRLVRVAIGPLALGDLAKGSWRHLSVEEQRALAR